MLLAALLLGGRTAAAETGRVVGRVRLAAAQESARERSPGLTKEIEARLAEGTARPSVDRRLISLRPRDGESDRFDATIYDHVVEQGFDLVVDGRGAEISRRALAEQPPLAPDELADAMSAVTARSPWSEALARRTFRLYGPMPPVTTDEKGRRLVNVGVQRPSGFLEAIEHEIVSVHVPSGEIVRWPGAAPPTGLATALVCGPPEEPCSAPVGSCAAPWHVEWPADSPVWKFDVLHPKCTQSVQPSGTGVEIRDVHYRDRLILARGHAPVLNVRYAANACGPFRDWLFAENCFETSGTSPAPGIVVSDGTAPTTYCDTGSDAGNFKGVAIHDEGSALVVGSEMDAGHYRYVMRWRFGLDGTIEPVFGFGATSDSCTCNQHFHHVYWRLEPALDGTTGDLSTGINTLERRVAGPDLQWSLVTQEGIWNRPSAGWTEDWWRLRNPRTGLEYVLEPGDEDGSAQGDDYARGDLWALAYNAGQIDDPNTSTTIRIDGWANGEALGASKRLVLWYRGGFSHDWSPSGAEPCHLVGPKLRPSRRCPADLALDRDVVGCSGAIGVTVDDPDEAGAGTIVVSARSGAEPSGEPIELDESPAGSGRFAGTIPVSPGPPTQADGSLSISHADTIAVAYLDTASCGAVDVPVERTATADCAPPSISAVAAADVTDVSAAVEWITDEPANSRVVFGTQTPPGGVAEDPANFTLAHALLLRDLAPCTTYRFSVSSADRAGNAAADPPGGGLREFRTAGRAYALGPDDVEVSRVAPCEPSLRSGGWSVSDRCRSGVANGTLGPGESAVLRVVALNAGLVESTGVRVAISTVAPGVTILDGEAEIADLAPGASAQTAAPHLALALSSVAECGGSVALDVRFTSDQGEWADAISLPVGGAGGTSTSVRTSADVPKPIPDFPGPSGISTVEIVDPGTLTDLDVGMTIEHTYDADLDLFLVAPDGRRVELSTDNGGGGDDFTGTVFDDEATTSVVAGAPPFSSSYRPEGLLSSLDGMQAAGMWTLEATDDGTVDVGTIHSWFLRSTIQAPACSPCASGAPASEVAGLEWTGSAKDTLAWSELPDADWYELREGAQGAMSALLDPGPDSCLRAVSEGAIAEGLARDPGEGTFLWYLVRAASPAGAGPAGAATAGPRIVDGDGPCP